MKADIIDRAVIGIVQARMSSKRLPGKVLADIAGRPMLAWVVERARRADTLKTVLVATSTAEEDDPIARVCEDSGFACYRGSSGDVLDRVYCAARMEHAEAVVRITADCPLIDAGLIDQAVRIFLGSDPAWDLVANRLPEGRDFPIGLDLEVCSMAALAAAWAEATEAHQREHVLPYIYENRQRFRVYLMRHEPSHGDLRWTVDEEADLALVRRISNHFAGRDDFSWLEVLALVESEPELMAINAAVSHKSHRDVW
jgi:spore coat polysaccharide biosynthesis protein SpsF